MLPIYMRGLITQVRRMMVTMTTEQRLEVFAEIRRDYCRSCGWKRKGAVCHCENDE